MIGSIKSRKVVDPKLHDLTASHYHSSAVEKDKVHDALSNTSNYIWPISSLKGNLKNPYVSSLKTGSRVGFQEPFVSYHAENDPLALSKKERDSTPKDQPAATRYLNSGEDLGSIVLVSSPQKSNINASGVTKTITTHSDTSQWSSKHLQNTLLKDDINNSRNASASSTLGANQRRHGAEMLKQKFQAEQNSGALAKLKETIKKQKENRSPNTSNSHRLSNLPFSEEETLLGIPQKTMATPVRKIAAGPTAPKYMGFNTAHTRLQTPDGKIWKEEDYLNQSENYKYQQKSYQETNVGLPKKKSSRILNKNERSSSLQGNSNQTHTKRKAVRKTGKIQLSNPIHKKKLITPSSWREGQKVAEAVLDSMLKNSDPQLGKETSLSTKLKKADFGKPDEKLSNNLEHPLPDEDNKLASDLAGLSAEAKAVFDDLKINSKEINTQDDVVAKSTKVSTKKIPNKTQTQKTDYPAIPKSRHYDPAKVQQYMARQKADRKRKRAEQKRIEKEANEKRMRLLNDLDKRQKEARKKTVSVDGHAIKEKKPLRETFIKSTADTPPNSFDKYVGYEGRLASLMHKLDQITKIDDDQEKSLEDHANSKPPVSKFLQKLGECIKDPGYPASPVSGLDDKIISGMSESKSASPSHNLSDSFSINQSPVVHPSKQDRIAALRAKSETLQERIDKESRRLVDLSAPNSMVFGEMLSPANLNRPSSSFCLDTVQDKEKTTSDASAVSHSVASSLDTSYPGYQSYHHEPSGQDENGDNFNASGLFSSRSRRSTPVETWEVVENVNKSVDHLDSARSYPGTSRQNYSDERFSVKEMMQRLHESEHCAKNNKTSWKESWKGDSKPSVFHSKHTENFQYDTREVDIPPWKRADGEKYSVMNVFTRKYMKTGHSGAPSSEEPQHTIPSSPRKSSPHRDRHAEDSSFVNVPFSNLNKAAITGGTEKFSLAPPDQASDLIRWSENLKRESPVDTFNETDESLSTTDLPFVPPPPTLPASLHFSPAVLEQKLNLELNRFETIGEQMHQLTHSERTQGVAMAQQETASIAQILQSRQRQHEMEMERLTLKAKERALEASQKLQEFQTESAVKEAAEKEKTAEEKRKMATDMQEEAHRTLKLQNEVAQASIKALSQQPYLRKLSSPAHATPSEKPVSKSYSSSLSTHTDPLSRKHQTTSSEDSSPTSMSEHSTTSVRPPVDDSPQESESTEKKSSSSIKEDLEVASEVDTSIRESISESSLHEELIKSNRKGKSSHRDVDVDRIRFDESMTEDERMELSKKAVMPSESHRRQKYKKSPRVTAASFLPDQSEHSLSSDDVSPYHTKNYLSGLDESLLSSTSLFGDADASSFNRFMDDNVRQYMREEAVRTRHQEVMLKLREKALKEKTKAELAWLEVQKQQFRNKGEDDRMPPLKKKKRAILRRWQVETCEIKRLKAANQDRVLLMQQQQDISRMMKTTKQFKDRLKSQGDDIKQGEVKSSTPLPPLISTSEPEAMSESDLNSSSANELFVKLKKSISGLDGRRLTSREKELLKRKKEAERLLEWKRKLDEEEKKVFDMEQQALQVWKSKEKSPVPDEGTPREVADDQASSSTTSISEEIQPEVTTQTSASLHIDGNTEDKRTSIEEEEYSQSFESGDLTSSKSDVKNMSGSDRNKAPEISTTPGSKPDESRTPLLGQKPRSTSGRTRDALEWSDESFSQTQSETEQSDVECRVHALKEELKRRRLIADRLKKQQKKKQKEQLRAQEASLKSQIEAYDAFIKSTQQELNLELDSPTSAVSSVLSHAPSAKPQIRSPRKSGSSRHIGRIRTSVAALSSPDASPRAGSQKLPVGAILTRQQSDSESSGRSSRSLSFDDEQHSPDDVASVTSKVVSPQSSEKPSVEVSFQAERPKKLDFPAASKSFRGVTSTSISPSSVRDMLLKSQSAQEKDRSKVISPTEVVDRGDASLATEDEVSERLSEGSTDRSGDSIPLFQINQSFPVDVEEDDDKTPVASEMATPTPSLPHTPTPDHPENLAPLDTGLDVIDGTVLPRPPLEGTHEVKVDVRSHGERADELSDKLLSHLLKDSIGATLSLYKSINKPSEQPVDHQLHGSVRHETPDVQPSLHKPRPKLTSSAHSVLQLLSKEQVDDTAERICDEVVNNLLDETLTKVLSIKEDHDGGDAHTKKSPEQETGSEVESIVRNGENEAEPVFARPVSPVFGAGQDADEWFDEDFGLSRSLPQLTSNVPAPDDWTNQLSPRSDEKILARDVPEVEYLVPHTRNDVMNLADFMIEFLQTKHALGQLYIDEVTSFEQFDGDYEEQGYKDAVERTFRQSIFDLVRELLREVYGRKEEKSVTAPWGKIKRKRRPSFCRALPSSGKDLISTVREEVGRLFGFRNPGSDPETRISLKWGTMKKKDTVDLLLIEELKEEEVEWTDYDLDEAAVKSQLTETVFDLLLTDTITCLNKLEQDKNFT